MIAKSPFIPTDLKLDSWQSISPYFDQLMNLPVQTTHELEILILNASEVYSVYSEGHARAYIAVSCHTDEAVANKRYELFTDQLDPEVEAVANKLNKKILASPAFTQLNPERYAQYCRSLKREIDLFCEANIPLNTQISNLSTQYNQIIGGLSVTIDGIDLPLPQASTVLLSADRAKRKAAWEVIHAARMSVKTQIDEIFSKLVSLRDESARHAGYTNFRDYKHDELERFDYSTTDVLKFHDAIEQYILPLAIDIQKAKRDRLGLTADYRPWDVNGTEPGLEPLKPFSTGEELLKKTIEIFSSLRKDFGENLQKMQAAGLFDLESRKGKAPGGYNYPLQVTGMPFIFMNAAGTHRDVTTLMHEGGHAMHTFLTAHEPLSDYRDTPSEMAETASMGMELITSSLWDRFYNPEDHKRAKREHLEDIIEFFPWFAIVDAFQHWVYLNPSATPAERDKYFDSLMLRFGTGLVNWQGLEHLRANTWQKQGHIVENPFYYIEYGIAQLGSLQVYRNFKKNPQEGLEGYVRGLKLGSSRSLPEVWQAMNIKFDFSAKTVRDLMAFVQNELATLE